MADKRRNPDPKGKLRLHVTPPVYDQNKGVWQVTVRANLRAGAQSSGAKLYFRVGGVSVGERQTDQKGDASMNLAELPVGKHEIEVSSSTGAFQTFSFEIAPKLQLELGEPDEAKDDDLSLSASALVSIDGRPVEGISVQFFRDGKPYKNLQPTDANGRAEIVFLKLTEKRYVFSAQLQGTVVCARQSLAISRKQDLRHVVLELPELRLDAAAKKLYATAIAQVSLAGKPLQNVAVDFYIDGECFSRGRLTDPDGRVEEHFYPHEGPRGYLVEAVIAGTTIRASKLLNVSGTTRNIPHTLSARAEGGSGKYKIVVVVSDVNGRPARDANVRLVITKVGRGPEIEDKETDADGIAVHTLRFSEPECDVRVYVGTLEQLLDNLSGPPRTPKPPSVPAAPKDVRGKSLLAAFSAGWKRGGEALRRQRISQLPAHEAAQSEDEEEERK